VFYGKRNSEPTSFLLWNISIIRYYSTSIKKESNNLQIQKEEAPTVKVT
jgi:hypothetical protein